VSTTHEQSNVRSRLAAYGRIPKDLLRDPEISVNAKTAYAILDEVAGHEQVTMDRLGSWLGASLRTAQRAVHELSETGWIEVHERFVAQRQIANEFVLNSYPNQIDLTPRPDTHDRGLPDTHDRQEPDTHDRASTETEVPRLSTETKEHPASQSSQAPPAARLSVRRGRDQAPKNEAFDGMPEPEIKELTPQRRAHDIVGAAREEWQQQGRPQPLQSHKQMLGLVRNCLKERPDLDDKRLKMAILHLFEDERPLSAGTIQLAYRDAEKARGRAAAGELPDSWRFMMEFCRECKTPYRFNTQTRQADPPHVHGMTGLPRLDNAGIAW